MKVLIWILCMILLIAFVHADIKEELDAEIKLNGGIDNNLFIENETHMKVIIEFKDEPLLPFEKNINKYPETIGQRIYTLMNGEEKGKVNRIKDQEEKIESMHNKILRDFKIERKNAEYKDIMNGLALTIRKQDFDKLKQSPNVKKIQKDSIGKLYLNDSIPIIGANILWNLSDYQDRYINGNGTIIAIIDTGIRYNVSYLEETCTPYAFTHGECNKTIYGWDFVNDDNDPLDDHSHGTHCAGIAAMDKDVKGVAPKAQLVAYKIFDSNGYGISSDAISAIENATKFGVDVISMSWGFQGSSDDIFETPINNAVALGIVPVVSAANSYTYYSITSPANNKDSIAVGATDDNKNLVSFSSKGPVSVSDYSHSYLKPDITAPGYQIVSIYGYGLGAMSGTSMSAPHIAGAAALLRQYRPNWTATQIKSIIINTATDINQPFLAQGGGFINLTRAINATTTFYPSTIYLGGYYTYYNLSIYKFNSTFSITNLDIIPIEYNLVFGEILNNTSFQLNNTLFSLAPNQTIDIYYNASFNTTTYDYRQMFDQYILANTNTTINYTIPTTFEYIRTSLGCNNLPRDVTTNFTLPFYPEGCFLPDRFTNGYQFTFWAKNDLVFDCNNTMFYGGNERTTSLDIPFLVFQSNHITIKNCNIKYYSWALFSYESNNLYFLNNTLRSYSFPIQLQESHDISIINNSITSETYSSIHSVYSHNNYIANNYINSSDTGSIGIEFSYSNNNMAYNNLINSNPQLGNPAYSVYLVQSSNNIFDNNNIGIFYPNIPSFQIQSNSNNNTIKNSNITSKGIAINLASITDFNLVNTNLKSNGYNLNMDTVSGTINITNSTSNESAISKSISNSPSLLIYHKNWLDADFNENYKYINNSYINITDNYNNITSSYLFNNDGQIRLPLTYSTQNPSYAYVFYPNYTINITSPKYSPYNQTLNMSENHYIYFDFFYYTENILKFTTDKFTLKGDSRLKI